MKLGSTIESSFVNLYIPTLSHDLASLAGYSAMSDKSLLNAPSVHHMNTPPVMLDHVRELEYKD
jgi:hypothetical protein